MSRLRVAGQLVLVALGLAAAGPVGSGPSAVAGLPEWKEPAQYRVDMVMQRGAETVVMQRFIDAGRARSEIGAQGMTMVMIERPDRGVAWIILPPMEGQGKFYLEQKLPKPETVDPRAPAGPPPDLRVRPLGSETVDGRHCLKYELTWQGRSALVWSDAETGAPVRMRDAEVSMEWRNYQVGPQPAALFEPPAGYERQVMPDLGDMSGMAGMMAAQTALGMAGGVAAQAAGQAGAAAGMVLGGPIGAMIGQYVGQYAASWLMSKGQQALMPGPGVSGQR